MIRNCNKDNRYFNLTFMKNLDCREANVFPIGSARNTGGQLVRVVQMNV